MLLAIDTTPFDWRYKPQWLSDTPSTLAANRSWLAFDSAVMVRIFHLHRENLVKEFEIIYLVIDINNFNFLVWTLRAGGAALFGNA